MRKVYPSDISRAQFSEILPILESVGFNTKPRTVDIYDVFCAVLYVLKSGCQWRMLPSDFPVWQTCYGYFSRWRRYHEELGGSLLDVVLKKISWSGSTKQWSERPHEFLHYRCSEREKHG